MRRLLSALVSASCLLAATSAAFASLPVRLAGTRAPVAPSAPATYGRQPDAATLSGRWTAVTTPPFDAHGYGTAQLLTDGSVLVSDNYSTWYRLRPDRFGNYADGTWSAAGPMPAGYGPEYFASAVLPDGTFIVEGGQYNLGKAADSNLGALYSPVTNKWTAYPSPPGWTHIGAGQTLILQDAQYMVGSDFNSEQAFYEGPDQWDVLSAAGKIDKNTGEGWTLLPIVADETVLAVDVTAAPNAEIFDEYAAHWHSAGKTPVALVNRGQIGPQALRPDGTVFVLGGTGATAIYNSKTGKWSAGPVLPKAGGVQLDVAKGPATVLPDGNVLFAASPGIFTAPSYWFEFDGKTVTNVASTRNAARDATVFLRTVLLPTGQVLANDASGDFEIYTSRGVALSGLSPVVRSLPTVLTHGRTYSFMGVRLNGFTQGSFYGAGAQSAANYPLVRITNDATKQVVYARTHDFSWTAIADPSTAEMVNFDVPATIGLGPSTFAVVSNGIPSASYNVTIK
jgi:hypothetical protein